MASIIITCEWGIKITWTNIYEKDKDHWLKMRDRSLLDVPFKKGSFDNINEYMRVATMYNAK